MNAITIAGITVLDATPLVPDRPPWPYHRRPDQVEGIAIHHDAGRWPPAIRKPTEEEDEIARIRGVYWYHTDGYWQWPGIGYNIYTFPSGRSYLVGHLNTVRAHVAGQNTPLVGIVLPGDHTLRPPDAALQIATSRAVRFVREWRGLELPVRGHEHWGELGGSGGSSCPGGGAASRTWVANIARAASAAPPEEEDDMALIGLGFLEGTAGPPQPGKPPFVSYELYATPSGRKRRKNPDAKHRTALEKLGFKLTPLSREELDTFADVG